MNAVKVFIVILMVAKCMAGWVERQRFLPDEDADYAIYCKNEGSSSEVHPAQQCDFYGKMWIRRGGLPNSVGIDTQQRILANVPLNRKPCQEETCNDVSTSNVRSVCNDLTTGRVGRDLLCDVVACLNQSNMFNCGTGQCIVCGPNTTPPRNSTEIIASVTEWLDTKTSLFSQNVDEDVNRRETRRLITEFETNYSREAAELENGTTIERGKTLIKVVTVPTHRAAVQMVTFDETADAVRIPAQTIAALGNSTQVKAVIVRWRGVDQNLQNVPRVSCDTATNCPYFSPTNSSLITVAYYQFTANRTTKVSLPVEYTVDLRRDFSEFLAATPPIRTIQSVRRQCVYWDEANRTWSSHGCAVKEDSMDSGKVMCSCNHTTSFATLLSVTTLEPPAWTVAVSFGLEYTTIAFLIVTIVLLFLARMSKGLGNQPQSLNRGDIRNNRTVTQVCLCVSLIALHSFLFSSTAAAAHTATCHAVAIGLHYFVLSAALWLLNEGITLVLKTQGKMLLKVNYKLLTLIQLLVAFGLPAVIVGLTNAIARGDYLKESNGYRLLKTKDTDTYGNYTGKTYPRFNNCTPNRENWVIYTVSIPVAVIVIVNIVLTAKTVATVYKVSKSDNRQRFPKAINCHPNSTLEDHLQKHSHWRSVLKAFCLLLPVSTLPWAFWLLIGIPKAANVFLGLHTVSNGLQGLGIFLVYCVVNNEERGRLVRLWRRSTLKKLLKRVSESMTNGCCYSRNKLNAKANAHRHMNGDIHVHLDVTKNTGRRLDESRGSNATTITNVTL